jgi:hypothetical protein
MIKNSIQISIPEPCHENWNAMTPREKGRYCTSCSKTVIDFSVMNDDQIIKTIQESTGNICGHFYGDQLNRRITTTPKPKWWQNSFWKYIVGIFLLLKGGQAKAQGKPVCTPVEQNSTPQKPVVLGRMTPRAEKEIKGKVTDENGEILPGVNIIRKGTRNGVVGGQDGTYTIRARAGETLVFSFIGFMSEEIVVGDTTTQINVTLTEVRTVMDGEVVIMGVIGNKPIQGEAYEPEEVQRIKATVLDRSTGLPIKNARVEWETLYEDGKIKNTKTDSKGQCRIKQIAEYDQIEVRVEAPGYEPGKWWFSGCDVKNENRLTWQLKPKPAELKAEHITPVEIIQPGLPLNVKIENPVIKPANLNPPLQTVLGGFAGGISVQTYSENIIRYEETVTDETTVIKLEVLPNPVHAAQPVTLRFKNDRAEKMMLQLTDQQGRILINQPVSAVAGENRVQVKLPAAIPASVVIVSLMNSKGKWVGTVKLVVEK